MILRDDEIQGRFRDLLNAHTRVDIATAWATSGEHLRTLADAATREQEPVKVRAIVGIAGNATRPDALEELYRITNGDLRIISAGKPLFHPKLYLFGRHRNERVECHAWVGSANFTNAGFAGHAEANEEIVVEIGPGKTADDLAAWFRDRWNRCPTDPPIGEVIRGYTEAWKQSPPDRGFHQLVSGDVSRRSDLLDAAHCPLTLQGYRQALKKCEEMLQDEGRDWEVLNPQGRSYMKVIAARRQLLLGTAKWSQLERSRFLALKGGVARGDSNWWGLLGRMARGHEKAVQDHEATIRPVLDRVVSAADTEFPEVAVEAMQELTNVDSVAHGTATLLLALARPDRLLSLNGASQKAYAKLSGMSPSTLGEPRNYQKLLEWLYGQRWYADSPRTDGDLEGIWRFRAALVDAFVYEPK